MSSSGSEALAWLPLLQGVQGELKIQNSTIWGAAKNKIPTQDNLKQKKELYWKCWQVPLPPPCSLHAILLQAEAFSRLLQTGLL